MFELLLVIHVFACILIIFFVLLQSGRGAELGAAFGSVGQANTVRGSMTGVGKITTCVAIVFMITSLTLAYLSSDSARDSVVRDIESSPSKVPSSNQMLLPEEDKASEKNDDLSKTELEQKVAPPIDSTSEKND